jgi:hypothetical protein
VFASEHESDPDDDAQNEADDETKTGSVPDGTFAQVENARRLVLVHRANLHLCPLRTTKESAAFQRDESAGIKLSGPSLFFRRMRATIPSIFLTRALPAQLHFDQSIYLMRL